MAARVTKRPVKLVVTREQVFQFVGYRPRTIQRVVLGASPQGALVAVLAETSRFDEFMEPGGLRHADALTPAPT
jgi:xanthine dehydrogenase YagR molybdenum-binding subunit